MIRAFTISFDFDGRTYLALATVKKRENNQAYYSVRVFDEGISQFLPDSCIQYSETEAVESELTRNPNAQRLFHFIKKSVAAHLQSSMQPR